MNAWQSTVRVSWLAAVLSVAGTTGLSAAELPAAANTWVKVAGAPGGRSSFGLVYLPAEKAFVCYGGSMAMNPEADRNCTNNPYTELTLNLETGTAPPR